MLNLGRHLRGFGYLFYAISPNETSFERLEDLPKPDYITRSAPYFVTLIILEQFVLMHQGKKGIRLNDAVVSMATGIMMNLQDKFLSGILVWLYVHVYENYHVVDLPWDWLGTWVLAALGADLAFYWLHRAAHEINFLWAGHQVHHSSEDYNLTTAIRKSLFQPWGALPFYLPMALAIPPTHALVHIQFNLLFQFWIHTECVDTLGPLEHVLNTPQHHRVHHGANRYCLDKNYAGALIIWDRLFGTFEWERKEEKTVYGLVEQPQFLDPMKHQLFYYRKIHQKAKSMDNLADKASAYVKGPGWFPGTERLGDLSKVPEKPQRLKYDPSVPFWLGAYVVVQFLTAFYSSIVDVVRLDGGGGAAVHGQLAVFVVGAFVFWTLTSCGQLFDGHPATWKSELVRASLMLALHETVGSSWGLTSMPAWLVRTILGSTILISMTKIATETSGQDITEHQKKKKLS